MLIANGFAREVQVFNSVSDVTNPAKMHLFGWLIAILITLSRLRKLAEAAQGDQDSDQPSK